MMSNKRAYHWFFSFCGSPSSVLVLQNICSYCEYYVLEEGDECYVTGYVQFPYARIIPYVRKWWNYDTVWVCTTLAKARRSWTDSPPRGVRHSIGTLNGPLLVDLKVIEERKVLNYFAINYGQIAWPKKEKKLDSNQINQKRQEYVIAVDAVIAKFAPLLDAADLWDKHFLEKDKELEIESIYAAYLPFLPCSSP